MVKKKIKITEASKIEQAKALKAIRAVLDTTEDYRKIKEMLSSSVADSDLDNAIKGLSEEDEFLLICSLMETATHFVRLEQAPIIRGDYIVPDFLARFQPGCYINKATSSDSNGFKCLIEIKSTAKPQFKMGGSLLKRRRQFADEFGLPLLFAVRLSMFPQNALWIIVEDADRKSTTLSVTVKDMVNGVRHVIWNEYWCMLLPHIYFVAVYDSKSTTQGIHHQQYGVQKEFRIVHNNKMIALNEDESVLYSALFEAFQLEEDRTHQNGSITYQALIPKTLTCSIVDLVYTFNRLARDEKGMIVYDPTRIIARSDSGTTQTLVTRKFIEWLIDPLFKMDIFGLIGIGKEDNHLNKWRQIGGGK